MSDLVRKMIQYMMANSCVTDEDFKNQIVSLKYPNRSASQQPTDQEIFDAVQKLNSKLRPFNMMIRSRTDDNEIRNYYVLISTVDNEITRAASHYKPKQFELFKLVLLALTQTSVKSITKKQYKELADKLNLGPSSKALLDEWCDKKWLFQKKQENLITIGVRSMAELDVLLESLS